MKGYLNIDGHEYYGYDVICKVYSWYLDRDVRNNNVVMNDAVMTKIKKGEFFDNTTPIPEGASLHIIQPCPIPNDDIRKVYKIKRTIDSGDFNVFPDIKTPSWWNFANVIVSEKTRSIILSERVYAGQKHDDAVTYANVRVYLTTLDDQWVDLLCGRLEKPCISYRRLAVNGANRLTPDMLYLLYKLGMKQADRENIEKFKLQLQAINQTNWRDYPNSVMKILNFANRKYQCACHVSRHKSERNKVTEQFYNIAKADFTDEDFKMLGDTMSLILDINETKYVSYSDMAYKMVETGIPASSMEEFFGCIVQLKRRDRVDA